MSQTDVLLTGTNDRAVCHAILIDDSAGHEIEGMDYNKVGKTGSNWNLYQVLYDPKNIPQTRNSTAIMDTGMLCDCIAGGPKRNADGIKIQDAEEIMRLVTTNVSAADKA